MRSAFVAILFAIGCARSSSTTSLQVLRIACAPAQFWDGSRCVPRGDGAERVAAGTAALAAQDAVGAKAALDAAAERGGPLDHETHVTLWEQRGIASAFLEDEAAARTAFDMLLALDPGHVLPYRLAPQVTFPFEEVRNAIKQRSAPAIDVNWPTGQKVGEPIALDLQVVADPKRFLRRATVFVRQHGTTEWRAADVALERAESRLRLPGVTATKPTSLELYLRAYDERGNEVLAWADPARPREIPLRYDPPPRWYRDWRTYAIGGTVLTLVTGVIVYAVTLAPPDRVDGSAGLE